ncbi:MAG: hypothetical protein JW724_04220 [Candidatus Altiarchaeota archaeon]|nr:hypothetical protein [Candidatus Altiarchaeota archaeon]
MRRNLDLLVVVSVTILIMFLNGCVQEEEEVREDEEYADLMRELLEDTSTSIAEATSSTTTEKKSVTSSIKPATTLSAGRVATSTETASSTVQPGPGRLVTTKQGLTFSIEEVPYEDAYDFTDVGGKLAFIAAKDGETFVVYDGKVNAFEAIPISINGKLAYYSYDKAAIIYDGKEVGEEYYEVFYPAEVNGKLAYQVRAENGKLFIVYDGNEVGREYEVVSPPRELDEKLAFFASAKGKSYIVYDGQEIPLEYDLGGLDFTAVNGKIAYIAGVDGKSFIVFDGKEGRRYDGIIGLTQIDGKITYAASTGGRPVIVYGEEELGREYEDVRWPKKVGGKLAYIAKKDGNDIIVYDGKEMDCVTEYKRCYVIRWPGEINDKLVYAVYSEKGIWIVREV